MIMYREVGYLSFLNERKDIPFGHLGIRLELREGAFTLLHEQKCLSGIYIQNRFMNAFGIRSKTVAARPSLEMFLNAEVVENRWRFS